jgi:hypothetical protein
MIEQLRNKRQKVAGDRDRRREFSRACSLAGGLSLQPGVHCTPRRKPRQCAMEIRLVEQECVVPLVGGSLHIP